MPGWTIEYSEAADRQLRKLDKPSSRRIVDYLRHRVASLDDPRVLGKALRGPLGDLWSYRVGDYRIICELRDERLCVLVVRLGHRKEIYR